MATIIYYRGSKITSFEKVSFGFLREVHQVEVGSEGEYEEFYEMEYAKQFVDRMEEYATEK